MNKIIYRRYLLFFLVIVLALPVPAFAVESAVDYTADTSVAVTSVGTSVTVSIASGSKAESVIVGATTSTVQLGTDSDTFTMKDTNSSRRMMFLVDGVYNTTCTASESSFTLSNTATTTYVIEPRNDTRCTTSGSGSGPVGGASPPPPAPAPAPPAAPPPAPTPAPPAAPPPAPAVSQPPAGAHPNGTLILDDGTIYLVVNGKRRGFRNPEEYMSHGYKFSQAVPATAADKTLSSEEQPIEKALDGTLVLDKTDGRTIYMIADGKKRGFTSAEIFHGLGYQFNQAIPVDLSDYPAADPITAADAVHPDGALVLDKTDGRTVWWVLGSGRKGFQSAEVFFTYGFAFDKIVPANDADMALAVGSLVKFRDGTLVSDGGNYYLISDGTKKPFASVAAMEALGYKISSSINADLSAYQAGSGVE